MKKANPKGFITIVAIAVFALLSIFGMIVQGVVIDAYRTIRDTNDYYKARDLSDSLIEYLQVELQSHEGGYNDDLICDFENGDFIKTKENEPYGTICTTIIAPYIPETDEVHLELAVEGRMTDSDLITGDCGNVFVPPSTSGCYMVPRSGEGDAGTDCNLYVPTNTSDQIDDACNWNKLQFGGSNTDRAVIPLFYEEAGTVVNPFYNGTPQDQFVVRIRTPECPENADTNDCPSGTDRYMLDETTNEVVVQWQINGVCDDGSGGEIDCGMVPWGSINSDGNEVLESSLITKKGINSLVNKNIVIKLIGMNAIDTNDYSDSGKKSIYQLIAEIKKPNLTLLLNKEIYSAGSQKSIPYLEYQVLSMHPISDAVKNIAATITVNGNVFERNLYLDEETGLIDFAIQN
ncbi:hypothetical protein GF354_00170 [Candidatus Peregrinibacteria bacterium]|nr:hypothetical protein [Candidatus Peregrinibacteria bacterium]